MVIKILALPLTLRKTLKSHLTSLHPTFLIFEMGIRVLAFGLIMIIRSCVLVLGTWQALIEGEFIHSLQTFSHSGYEYGFILLSFLVFLLLQQWRRFGCFVKFPCLRQTPLCGVRDHLIIDLAHRCTSSSPDTILQFCLELQMAIEPFCALGTESFLETIWKEMAICYLIYTLLDSFQ